MPFASDFIDPVQIRRDRLAREEAQRRQQQRGEARGVLGGDLGRNVKGNGTRTETQ